MLEGYLPHKEIFSIREHWKLEKDLFESLLVYSMGGENIKFPTIKEFILSEVVNGVIGCLGGEHEKINYREYNPFGEKFERKIWNFFEEETKKFTKGQIDSNVLCAIKSICNPGKISNPEIYFLSEQIFSSAHSTTSLPYEILKKVKEKTIPLLNKFERESVENIGKHMRIEIEKDLEYIKKTYSW